MNDGETRFARSPMEVLGTGADHAGKLEELTMALRYEVPL